MKVLNLRCAHGHLFEGWFASEDDFLDQNGRGLIDCPICADKVITRMPSAPRLNLGARDAEPKPPTEPPQSVEQEVQAVWMRAVQQVIERTEDVGPRFAEEARRIHYGETEHRGIRGQATAEERAALAEEGIEAHPLFLPPGLTGPAH